MKKMIAVSMLLLLFVAACSSSPEDKVKDKMKQMHPLTSEEQLKAENSAKQFFNKDFPAVGGVKKGMFQECRPSDSNFNGLVTCLGYIPNQRHDIMDMATRYCTYSADMVMGCSNEDK